MVPLLISAIAITVLTGFAWALGFRNAPVLNAAAAIAEAEGRLAGFQAASVALASDGRGAVLRDAAGRIALVLPLGDGWVVRRLPPGARLKHEQGVLHTALAEPMLHEARLPLEQVPGWLEGSLA